MKLELVPRSIDGKFVVSLVGDRNAVSRLRDMAEEALAMGISRQVEFNEEDSTEAFCVSVSLANDD